MTQKSFKKPIKFSDTMVDFGAMSVVLPFYVETNNVPIGEVNFLLHILLANIHVFNHSVVANVQVKHI